MSTELKLTLNAEAYYAELEKVIQTAKQSSARIKDSADVRNAGMEDFAKGAKTAAESTAKIGISAKAAGKDIKNITVPAKGLFSSFREGIKGVTEELRDGAGASKVFAGRLKGILSPLGLLVAGLSAVVAYALACWDKLSGGAEAAAARAEKAVAKAAEARQKEEERIARTQEYMNKLVALSTAEGDAGSKMALSKTIIAALSSEYGNLGIQVDAATGKILGLAEAQAILDEKQRKSRIKLAEKELNALQKSAYKQADLALTEMMPGASKLAFLGIDMLPGDVRRNSREIMANRSLEDRLKYAQGMYDRATNKEDLDNWGKVVDTLEDAIEKQKELDDLYEHGGETPHAKIEKQAQAQREVALASDALSRYERDRRMADIEYEATHPSSAMDPFESKFVGLHKQKDILQQELDAAAKRRKETYKQYRGINIEDPKTERELQARAAIDTAELAELKAKDALKSKEREILELEESRKEAVRQLTDAAKYELEYNDLLARGEYQKAEALKLERELKSQNLVLTKEETDEILKQREALKSLNIAQSLQNRADSLAEKLAGQSGQGEAYAVQKALRDAERSKGFALTEDERSLTERLAKMEFSLANPGRSAIDTLKGTEIKTNALTARGGFASGAVVPDKDRTNMVIREHTKAIRDKMSELVRLQNVIKGLMGT